MGRGTYLVTVFKDYLLGLSPAEGVRVLIAMMSQKCFMRLSARLQAVSVPELTFIVHGALGASVES